MEAAGDVIQSTSGNQNPSCDVDVVDCDEGEWAPSSMPEGHIVTEWLLGIADVVSGRNLFGYSFVEGFKDELDGFRCC